MTFHIVFFETNSGKTPVKDFIDNLDPKTQAKIARSFDLLEEFGPLLKEPYIKPLGYRNLYELRVRWNKLSLRFLFFMPKYNIIVILHSYIKKSNKIPKNELLIATSRLKEFLRENK